MKGQYKFILGWEKMLVNRRMKKSASVFSFVYSDNPVVAGK